MTTYLKIKEFREVGLLQEANRRFFHPLGLALEVKVDAEGNETLGGIWTTDDPEGWAFEEQAIDRDKVARVNGMLTKERRALYSNIDGVQPA